MSMFKLFLLFTFFFFFNDPATTEIYTLSLHDALPIYFPEVKLDRKMIDIAATIMERQAGKFEPAEFRDRYQDALRELIESKIQGGPPRKSKAPETGGNVVDLMDALRRSLANDKSPAPANTARAGKKTAKSDKRQASLLLPIKGSEKEKAPAAPRAATPRTAARRKRA